MTPPPLPRAGSRTTIKSAVVVAVAVHWLGEVKMNSSRTRSTTKVAVAVADH